MTSHIITTIIAIAIGAFLFGFALRQIFPRRRCCKNCGSVIEADPDFPRTNDAGFCHPLCHMEHDMNSEQ